MAKLVIFLVVAALLFLLARTAWQRLGRGQRQRFIDAYPYDKFLDRRLAARRPELSASQREQVFAGLREYFHLCNTAGRRLVAMPSQAVDDAWHEFILFTRHYDKFCRQAFGRFLHHTPAEAMATPTQATQGIKRAWRLSCAREGIDPRKPARLPALFALDAALGIAGGFVYSLDCLAARHGVAAAGNDSAFCASHIGCGGGCSGSSGCTGGSDGSGDGGSSCGGGCGGGGGD